MPRPDSVEGIARPRVSNEGRLGTSQTRLFISASVRRHIDKEPNRDVVGGSVCARRVVHYASLFVFVLGIWLAMRESVWLEMGIPV
jgi:hypothetical protein